jgi:hypothetical protein
MEGRKMHIKRWTENLQERQHLEDTITWEYNTKHFLKSKDVRV